MTEASLTHWVLTIVCTDRPGIVHAISGAILEAKGNITGQTRRDTAQLGYRRKMIHSFLATARRTLNSESRER